MNIHREIPAETVDDNEALGETHSFLLVFFSRETEHRMHFWGWNFWGVRRLSVLSIKLDAHSLVGNSFV